MSTIICANCNSENTGESELCQVCGAPIQDGLTSKSFESDAPYSDPPDAGARQSPSPNPLDPLKKSPPQEDVAPSERAGSTLAGKDDLNEWLRELPSPKTGELAFRTRPLDADGALPTWLQEVRSKADEQSPAGDPGLGNWRSGREGDDVTPAAAGETDENLPDWVSALLQPDEWPEVDDPEAMAEWFSNAEDDDDDLLPQTSELAMTTPLESSRELNGIPEQLVGQSLPEWLMGEEGEDEDEDLANFQPTQRIPLIGKADDQSWDDNSLTNDEFISEQDDLPEYLALDNEALAGIEARNLGPAALVAAGGEDKLFWLEDIEDQEIEAALDEILLQEYPRTADQEVEDVSESDPPEKDLIAEGQDANKILAETLILGELASRDQEADPSLDETLLIDEPEPDDQEIETILAELSTAEKGAEEQTTAASGDWLGYLEDAPAVKTADSINEPALQSDIELERAEIPEWLRTMKPGEPGLSKSGVVEESRAGSGPLAGLRDVIPIAVAATGAGQIAEPAKFEITKEQQQQVALLRQLTLTSPELPRERTITGKKDGVAIERLVLGLLLILVILIGWFLPVDRWLPFLSEWTLPEATESAYELVDQLGNKSALLAFEYTPAMAGELDVVADSILAELVDNNSSVITVSQAAAGVAMAHQALERSEIEKSYDLGFLPGDAVGLRGLGSCLSAGGECNSLVGLPLDAEAALLLEDVSLIIILTSDRDSLVNWIEQVGLQTEVPVLAGLTQSLSPVASPYLASEQLAGLIEGAPAAAIYNYSLDGTDTQDAQLLRSFTLAQWLVIAVMIAGGLYFGLSQRSNKAAQDMGMR